MLAIPIEILFLLFWTKKTWNGNFEGFKRSENWNCFQSIFFAAEIAPVPVACADANRRRIFRPSDDKREINIHVVSICEAIQSFSLYMFVIGA